jgi:hypothetical protein
MERLIGSEIIEEISIVEEEEKFDFWARSKPISLTEQQEGKHLAIFQFLNSYPGIESPAVQIDIHKNQSIEAGFDVIADDIMTATVMGCAAFFEALEHADVNGKPTEPIEDY